MPDTPYPITSDDPKQAIKQMKQLVDELFQERVAGTLIGDVFQAGDDDVLTLNVASAGGLEKSSSALTVKTKTAGGLEKSSDGVSAKAGQGITVDATGISVDNSKIWPIGSVFMATVATNPNTLLGFGTWTTLHTGNLTLT